MKSNNIKIVLNENTMSELGKQFGRAYGAASQAVVQAALSETVDAIVREMIRVNVAVPCINHAVEEFKRAAGLEWNRVSNAIRSTTPGRA